MPCAYTRQKRLTKTGEFNRVFLARNRIQDRLFSLVYAISDQERARLGLAIAKKNLRRAVDRNRVKRLTRESFRQSWGDLPALDIVVLAKKEVRLASNKQIFQSLESFWQKLMGK
ncbi:ribonuclease P protein component [Magnetovirga frankeli]|uniref:ribonuclease P protein component n=1 Tax=Magnetovirga frankeli TaxID=947516 RepID=UPI0012933FED|nr:ribonuclease P protein component [gamma proteobacterium SS-5]